MGFNAPLIHSFSRTTYGICEEMRLVENVIWGKELAENVKTSEYRHKGGRV